MMRRFTLLAGLVLGWLAGPVALAQAPTFAHDIAPIVYNNCTKCHRQGGIAPFALESYDNAQTHGVAMKYATEARHMPPWPPDASYTHFRGERLLTEAQIQQIGDWVNAGMPRGIVADEPAPPVFTTVSRLSVPADTTIIIPTFTIPSNTDLYRCYVLPSGLAARRFVKSLEMAPGNGTIVHHMLLYADTSGRCRQFDAADPGPGYTSFGGVGVNNAPLLGGWAPGADPIELPGNFGMQLEAHADLVLQVHYSPGSQGLKDSSLVRLVYWPPGAHVRPLYQAPILNHETNLVNGPLDLAAGQAKMYHEAFTSPIQSTILAVFPHGHLLCQNWKVFATTLARPMDTIPIIRIPMWHFHWQNTYFYRRPLILPPFTKLEALAYYDNSDQNPVNPTYPPVPVHAGEGTLDEMMLVYFAFAQYQAGDENLIFDTTSTTAINNARPVDAAPWHAAAGRLYANGAHTLDGATIYSADGRLLHRLTNADATRRLPTLPPGVYVVDIAYDGTQRQRLRVGME